MNVNIKSYTTAQKAANYLRARGVKCEVTRGLGRGAGCGFVLRISDGSANAANICAMLNAVGVQCDPRTVSR